MKNHINTRYCFLELIVPTENLGSLISLSSLSFSSFSFFLLLLLLSLVIHHLKLLMTKEILLPLLLFDVFEVFLVDHQVSVLLILVLLLCVVYILDKRLLLALLQYLKILRILWIPSRVLSKVESLALLYNASHLFTEISVAYFPLSLVILVNYKFNEVLKF